MIIEKALYSDHKKKWLYKFWKLASTEGKTESRIPLPISPHPHSRPKLIPFSYFFSLSKWPLLQLESSFKARKFDVLISYHQPPINKAEGYTN